MANNTFTHTSSTGTVTTLTWDTHGHLIDDPTDLTFNDDYKLTRGGTDYTREYGDDHDYFTFSGIVPKTSGSKTDEADVLSFFAIVKRLYTFVWNDENGTARTVRNITNPVRSENFSGIHRKFTIQLRVQ